MKLSLKLILSIPILGLVGCQTDYHALDFSPNPNVSAHNQAYSGSALITAVPGNQALISSQDSRLGTRTGKSSQYTLFGFVGFGKGMADAANSAGIQQVTSIERNTSISVFPIFKKTTITVTGEPSVTPSTQYMPRSSYQSNDSKSIPQFFPPANP